ncbi:MAG TPA: CHRD domain-containing protein [Puia sp.]|nr:CHRD domain-containing protein [Puia sp.]
MKTIPYYVARVALICFCAIASFMLSCGKGSSYGSSTTSPIVSYAGTFAKSSPGYISNATGTVKATFNTTTLQLSYQLTWDSLSTTPIAMHFHDDGPVIVPINGYPVAQSGTVQGVATLTSQQSQDLAAGLIYAMIHTSTYTSGEIQAYLKKQ